MDIPEPTPIVWIGDTVRRPVRPGTPAVHALLRYLEAVGFPGSPRVVGDGYDEDGRQVLTYVEGVSIHPHAWSDEGVWHVGRLLRDLHDATAGFRPPPDAVWPPWFFRSPDGAAIIGHGDTGPWNIIARDGLPVGFIDWEFAGPIDRLDEIAAPSGCDGRAVGRAGSSGLEEAARPGALAAELVVRVGEDAPVDRQAAAADALAELVAQLLQAVDPLLQLFVPPLGEALPVLAGRGATVGELAQGGAHLGQRDPDPLRDPDQGDPPKGVAVVPALVARGTPARDQALPLVEVEGRDRHAAAGRELPDRELLVRPGWLLRHVYLNHS
jgi:hypothetical protein